MFPFKKKPAPACPAPPCANEQVNRKLDETNTKLEEVMREVQRRLDEKKRRVLSLVVSK